VRLSTKLSGIVAIGGVAALGAGLISSGGIGANFIADADATASVSVGNFDCAFVSPGTGVTLHDSGHTAEVALGLVKSSSGQKTVSLTLQNTGDISLAVNWLVYPEGDAFVSGHMKPIFLTQNTQIGAGSTTTYNVGATWQNLDNKDLNTTGSVNYMARCVEPASSEHPDLILFARNGASSNWVGDNVVMDFPKGIDKAAGAYAVMNTASGELPSVAPSATIDGAGSGTPRIQIQLSDGAAIQSIPDANGHVKQWTYYPVSGANFVSTDWSAVRAAAGSVEATTVQLLGDTSGSGGYTNGLTNNALTNTVSCLQYDSEYFIGSNPSC
jgi:hypothetical protein